jgi:uncharacterized protein (TIGR03437 family)
MKAPFRNLPFALFLMAIVALFSEVAAEAAGVDTAIRITAGVNSICMVGSCDDVSLQVGALNNSGNADSIPSTPFNFTYTFPATTDKYILSGSYLSSYDESGIVFTVLVAATYVGNSGGTSSQGDSFTLDFLQDIFDNGPGTFDGTYTETLPVTLAANTSVAGNLFWNGQGVGALGPFVGPGSFDGFTSNNLARLDGDYLEGDFRFTFNFVTGAVPGATALVDVIGAPLSITSSGALGGFMPGQSVSASFGASGGNPPYTWSASGLPSGFTLNPASGALAGVAPQPGNYSFNVTAMDSAASSAGITASFSVLGFTTNSPLPPGSTTTSYSTNILAAGGTPPYTFAASGVPAGLSMASSGFLSGTPTAPGSFSLSVTVTDSQGLSVNGSFALTISSTSLPVQVSGAALPDGTLTASYSQALEAEGGKPPYSWSIIGGSLPAGLQLSGSGTISGTPSAIGLASFTARATDTAGGFASAVFTIMVDPNGLRLTSISLPNGIAGSTYPPQTIAATGGITPYKSFAITSGSPAGLSFSNDLSNAQISGVPTSIGSFGFTITATDQAGNVASGSYSLTIEPPHADLILSQGSVSFALATGATALPAGSTATIPVLSSSTSFQQLNYAVAGSPVSWLDVSGGPATPAPVGISLDPSALNLAPGNYQTSIAVTCQAPSPCNGSMRSITVNLVVTSPAPQLSLSSGLLSFSVTGLTAQTLTQFVSLQNTGGGSISINSVSASSPWVTLSGIPSTVTAGQSIPITVTVDTTSLTAGYYQSTITVTSSAGSASVPVTLLLSSSPTMTLNPGGSQFLTVTSTAPGNTQGSFLVSVSGSSTVNWTASVPAVANAPVQPSTWLTLTTTSGSSTPSNPGAVNFSIAPASLAAGTYYGTIRVTEAASDTNQVIDSPQDYVVVLNIAPASVSTLNPSPAGLIFIATGTVAPPPQTVQVFASAGSTASISYLATPSTVSGGSWLSVGSPTGSTSPTSAGQSTVSVSPGKLVPGVYRGTVTYQLQSGGTAPAVNVTLIVENSAATPASTNRTTISAASASCTPSQIVPAQTGLASNFAQPTSWPTPLTIKLLDDCANGVPNGQVIATFTNGDPPLVLQAVDTVSGTYSGTWTPHATAPQVTIAARATAKGFAPATLTISGQVTPNVAPVLSPNGTVNIFVPVAGSPLAPGMIVQIYGLNLAAQALPSSTVPLTTSLGNTSVLIGGVQAPLYYVGPNQINAQVPFELTPGKPYQVLIDANGALSTPSGIQVGPDAPGIAAFASGQIIAQHANGAVVSDANPAAPGEYVVFYVAGMGLTTQTVGSGQPSPSNPAAATLDQPTLTLNGQSIPASAIYFAGLTPTFVGLYQVNFQIPLNTPNGDLQLVVTQSGGQSNQTVLAVHN